MASPAVHNVPLSEADSIRLKHIENLYRELVSGQSQQPYLELYRGLPKYADDAERDFGIDIYNRMLNDPAVFSSFESLRAQVMGQGPTIIPAVMAKVSSTPEVQARAKKALEVCDLTRFCLSNLEVAFDDVVYQMMDAFAFGHKLAELVFDEKVASFGGRIVRPMRAIDVKPREVYRMVVDRHGRLMCVMAIIPGVGLTIQEGIVPDPSKLANTISPDKFCILTVPGRNRDPRGRSLLRPAYNAWWLKMQTWPELLKWLSQFAGGAIIGYTPPDTVSADDGTLPEDTMVAKLQAWRNGLAIALRGGSKVDINRADGDGQQFWTSLDGFDRQIYTAVLGQAKSHKEAEHDSKANMSGGTDITDAIVRRLQGLVARTFERSVFRQIVKVNLGEEALEFTPRLMFGETTEADKPSMMTAAAALWDHLTPTQQAELSEWIGLTPEIVEEEPDGDDRQQGDEKQPAAKKPAGKKEAA